MCYPIMCERPCLSLLTHIVVGQLVRVRCNTLDRFLIRNTQHQDKFGNIFKILPIAGGCYLRHCKTTNTNHINIGSLALSSNY